MKQDPKQDAWIPMADYLYRGVRKPKIQVVPFDDRHKPSVPETWVPLEDHLLHGVRKSKQTNNDSFIERLKPLPPAPDVPKEAYLTIFDALQEIWSVPKPNGPVFARLNSMQATDLTERKTGRITQEEFQRRQAALDAIRSQFAINAENVTEWFLNNRFRLFATLPNA